MKIIKIPAHGMSMRPVNTGMGKGGRIKDLVPNVNYKDALIRFGITILLPIVLLMIDKHLIIYAAPVMAYLFISAIAHFCIVKYVWHRYIKHEPAAPAAGYAEDLNYPEESV